MLAPALRLDMALYSTSMTYDLAPPIVTLPIVALPIVAFFTFQVSSSTFLCYILATVSVFSVSSSVEAKVRHSSVFRRLEMM